jgi:hypothetical protein
MADRDNYHNHSIILDERDDAVVAHPIRPEFASITPQGFAQSAWRAARDHALLQVLYDSSLNGSVELVQLVACVGTELNRPTRAPS